MMAAVISGVESGAMNFLKLLTIGARKGRVRTLPELATAIGEGAAFLAQGISPQMPLRGLKNSGI